ncbi:MAG: hypothetical protein AAF704_13080, partial [Cyanobacteria bacterium P01_D01_bin.123]
VFLAIVFSFVTTATGTDRSTSGIEGDVLANIERRWRLRHRLNPRVWWIDSDRESMSRSR